jgi:LysM repeat protein
MFFNQELKGCRLLTCATLAAALAGCSFMPWTHSKPQADPPAAAASESPPGASTPAATAESDLSATDRAIANAGTARTEALAESPRALPADALQPNAPKSYTVKSGDTLWGIAQMYLKDPWLWPEIWYVNPKIPNPHLIYPGDVLALAYGANGEPQVRVVQEGAARLEPALRSSPTSGAIPTLPYSTIAAFLSRPKLVTSDEAQHSPHVLAFRDEHQVIGAPQELYAMGLDGPEGAHFTVIHVGEQIKDPDSGKFLGYEGLYTGTAVMVRRGQPAKLQMLDSARETLRGDILFADTSSSPLNFEPRAPSVPVKGRIVSVVDNVHTIGQFNIVIINRGKRQGVDVGTVLAIDQAGELVPDRGPSGWENYGRSDLFARKVRLPDEREGTLLVFKSYDDVSWGLVVGATEAIQVRDIVRNP